MYERLLEISFVVVGQTTPNEPIVLYTTEKREVGEKIDQSVFIECFITGV